jgi:hypothetical protein
MFDSKGQSIICLIICALLFVQCSAAIPAQQTDTNDKPAASLEEVADIFVQAAAKGSVEDLKIYFPDVALARLLSPEKSATQTDKKIEEEMLAPLVARFTQNIMAIHDQIESAGIPFDEVSLIGTQIEPSKDPALVPRVLTIVLGTNQRSAKVPVTYLELDGRFYLFEILFTSNLFK